MDKMAVPLSPNISFSEYQLTTVSLTYIITHMTSSSHLLSAVLSFFLLLCFAGIYADAYDNAMGGGTAVVRKEVSKEGKL